MIVRTNSYVYEEQADKEALKKFVFCLLLACTFYFYFLSPDKHMRYGASEEKKRTIILKLDTVQDFFMGLFFVPENIAS